MNHTIAVTPMRGHQAEWYLYQKNKWVKLQGGTLFLLHMFRTGLHLSNERNRSRIGQQLASLRGVKVDTHLT